MKVLNESQHLTAMERKAIAQMMQQGMTTAHTKKKGFILDKLADGTYRAIIESFEVPWCETRPRWTSRTVTFKA